MRVIKIQLGDKVILRSEALLAPVGVVIDIDYYNWLVHVEYPWGKLYPYSPSELVVYPFNHLYWRETTYDI